MSQNQFPPLGAPPSFVATPPPPPRQVTAPQSSARRWAKPLRFGLLGAIGCLLAALLGEGWLWLMRPAPPPPLPPTPPQAVSLVLDTSGSMMFGGLSEVQEAAKQYLDTQDLTRDRAAIVHFDSGAEISSPLSHNRDALKAAVDSLETTGTTAMDQGLQQGLASLQGAPETRSILLFTDGAPDDSFATVQAANALRTAGIQLVVVATDGADFGYLEQLTGDPSKVVQASSGSFGVAFQQAQRIIAGYDFSSSAPTRGDTRSPVLIMLVIAVWTALLGLGVAAALVWGQAHYFHRRPFEKGFARREALGLLGGAGAGLVSGAAAQLLFAGAGSSGIANLGRLLSWGMLGGILASGMAIYVPNLDSKRALLFGGLGGLAAAIGYSLLAKTGSDTVARLASAALLGFAIGLLVALAEETFRRVWLKVEGLGKSEVRFDVNLGAEPIAVGADRARCLIYAPGARPVEGRFGLEGGRPYLQRGEAPLEWLHSGEAREFGSVRVTLSQPRSELEGIPPFAAPYGSMPYGAPPHGATPPFGTRSAPAPYYDPHSSYGNMPSGQPAPLVSPGTAPYGGSPSVPASPYGAGGYNPTAFGAPAPHAPTLHATVPTRWQLENPAQSVQVHAGQTLRVGRLPENDIVLGESSVSSSHARLTSDFSGLHITDLGSTNGTWVNEVRLAPETSHPLREGDAVRLGAFVWQVRGAN